jgi:hypothetical protein
MCVCVCSCKPPNPQSKVNAQPGDMGGGRESGAHSNFLALCLAVAMHSCAMILYELLLLF